jgi:hypothetical protein
LELEELEFIPCFTFVTFTAFVAFVTSVAFALIIADIVASKTSSMD